MGFRSGVLLIDKPAGMTSAFALNRIKKVLPRGTKIGHGGTLDPFATGLLVVFIGNATRLSQCFLAGDKEYETTIRLGVRTDSGDLTGNELERYDRIPTDETEMSAAARSFVGRYLQTPPMFSAIKVGGRPLYERARKGETIERVPKERRIDAFDLVEFCLPEVRARVACSGGTYVRTLAEDWAEKLGSVAMLTSLRRTRSSRFDIRDAVTLDAAIRYLEGDPVAKDDANIRAFVSIDRVFDSSEGITLDANMALKLLNGERKVVDSVSQMISETERQSVVPIFDVEERLIALFLGQRLAAVFNQSRDE